MQQLLEAYALHSVEFDADEHRAFRSSIRDLADRFQRATDHRDFLILAGETNKTIQSYNQIVERFIRELSREKQLAVELLAQSLLRVCHSSGKAGESLRRIEKELGMASQLSNMRELRTKLAECVGTLCLEAEVQEAQYQELKERVSESSKVLEARDQVTGLSSSKTAESRIAELGTGGRQGYAVVFYLKNVEVVNRRFGFEAGDKVLRRFAAYLGTNLQGKDQLFRWRGPCFALLSDRVTSFKELEVTAYKMGVRGPEVEVEGEGKSMLIRLTAATTVFLIPKGDAAFGLAAKIDQFAAEQFKMAPAPR